MEKIRISKVRILLPIFFVALLFLTPFLSTSMMSSYILNLLIVFLGLQAGFLSSTSKSRDESEKHHLFNTIEATYTTTSQGNTTDDANVQPQIVLIKQIAKQGFGKKEAIKRCKSRPSIFFIGNDHELEIDSVEKNEEMIILKEMEATIVPMKRVGKEEKISKHELYMMTETFIGNFYKQLKVDAQVETSRKVA